MADLSIQIQNTLSSNPATSSLDEQSIKAIINTTNLILSLQSGSISSQVEFDPSHIAYVPSSSGVSTRSVKSGSSASNEPLALLAQCCSNVAVEKGFSSVLLGATSESDEYGDVPVYLDDPNGEIGTADDLQKRIAKEFGLEGAKISKYTLPSSSSKAVKEVLSTAYPDSDYGESYSFKVEGSSGGSVVVLCFWKRGKGWVGLVGGGVWT